MSKYPQVLLFDIGGVCVVSPMQAILDYEKSKGIPLGYVNHAISGSGPSGAWSQIESGQILLDDEFFRLFKADLTNERRWREYYARSIAKTRNVSKGQAAEEAAYQVPPVPDIDAEWLYWRMMSIARQTDPHMWPALQKLRKAADGERKGQLILGALSNTSIFPANHPLSDETTPEGKQHKELKGVFDIFVSSAHVGLRKPDEAIYKYAITRLHEHVKLNEIGMGVRPQDITFLDDIGTNLRTAKNLGMNTIKVQLGRADLAVKELEKITGLSLQDDKAKL
ncbi:Putative phosphoglycolate phosphatase-like, domain 2, HAD superfamily [Septoria linicola]|uniref:Phosphoglycolate phosphatase-like, domain 2, HAD superfamily n=1 Tax=Septoria linicola TaxID=215465 RepID=A0A9Q9AGF7_9PEZI|nr:putative phosphoglycolate phosphatase-like, domain 2, HAD superfamily [Septoria linicola]USW47124.1 Putative phosphoglycolate phosphatase-like, domain 2, HAD superfamily [Septoria linicola]